MLNSKTGFFAVCLFACTVGVFAQQTTVNPATINPSQMDLAQVNLSHTQFYFQGPAEFYVTGIKYKGMTYSAILDYDGMGNFTVHAPNVVSTAGKPQSINLSNISVRLGQNGIELQNVGINGAAFSGTLTLAPNNDLAMSNYTQTGSLAAAEQQQQQASRAQIADLQNKLNSMESQVSTLQNQVSSKNSTISSLQSQVATQNQTISNLRQQLASQQPASAAAASSVPSASDYPYVVGSGFSAGSGALGSWTHSGGDLLQTDSSMLFAKYVMQVPQQNSQYFYQIAAQTTGSGWHGFGVHLLASGSQTADGYGYGDSYLVWVTQDPQHLQTDQTFVQLYRSFNDVHMTQVASKAINGSIDQHTTVSVAVNRSTNTITVLADGHEVFTYQATQPLAAGNSIALRALGSVRFTSEELRTK